MGSAQASVVIDLSQAEASVARMRQIAQQIRQQIDQINRASGAVVKTGQSVDLAAINLQTTQLKAASNERIAQARLETERIKAESEKRIAQMRKETEEAKLAQRQRELSQKSQTSLDQERKQVNRLFTEAITLIKAQEAEEDRRHQKMMTNIEAEARRFDALRDKAGDTTASTQLLGKWRQTTQVNQPVTTQQINNLWGVPQVSYPGGGVSQMTQRNLSLTQANPANTIMNGIVTQAIGSLQTLTQPFQAQVTATFAPVRATVQQQMRLIAQLLAQARSEIGVQQQQFRSSAAIAPATVSRAPVTEELAKARQPIAQLAAQFAQLRVAITAAGNDQNALSSLDARINQLLGSVQRMVSAGFVPATKAVRDFGAAATSSRTGLQGYFTAVREGLERLNEVSLAANLQEISFRLLPAGIIAGAATQRGIETAQGIETARVNLQAFTGTEAEANVLMNQLTDGARRLGQPMFDVLDVMTQFAPQLRAANIELDDAFSIASRLVPSNPREGMQGALYALSEAAAGQFVSLRRRFNVDLPILQPMIDQKGLIGGLDEYLSKLGRTRELAEALGNTGKAAFQRMNDALSNFLASTMDSYLEGMNNAANVTAKFFDSLAESGGFFRDAVGGLLLFTNALTTGLITLGQFALAFNAIKILVAPVNAAGQTAGLAGWAASQIQANLSPGIIAGFSTAAPVVTSILRSAVTLAVRGGLLAATVAGGAFIGTRIAAAFNVGGSRDPEEQANRLNQILFVAIAAVVEPLFVFASILKNSIDAIGLALDLIGTTIARGASDLGNAIVQTVRKIGETFNVESLKRFGEYTPGVSRFVNEQTGAYYPAPGVKLGSPEQSQMYYDIAGDESKGTLTFIEGYAERQQRILDALANPPTIESMVQAGVDAAQTLLTGVYNFMFDQYGASGAETGTGAGGISGGAANNADLLDQVYSAALNHMIQNTRQLADMALAAAREAEDWAIQQLRTYEDFNRQMMQGQEDYLRQQAQSQDDFNRQMADEEEGVREQRKKQEDDFAKQQLRAAQDHAKNMLRLARDVDDAISARDFLAAQKALQRIQDEREDYEIERARRLEDYEAQIEDLEENLKEQQEKRREDFARQQRLQAENYALQLRRQQENFARQQQREQEDRNRRLMRQEQDYQIAYRRREQDFALQMLQLQNHNNITRFYWQYGLSSLENDLLAFFARIGATDIGTPFLPPPIPEGPGGKPFAQGVWNVPFDMNARVHRGEIITPAPFAESVRRGDAVIGGRSGGTSGGDTYYVTVPIDARGSDLNDRKLDELEQRITVNVKKGLERSREQRRGARAS